MKPSPEVAPRPSAKAAANCNAFGSAAFASTSSRSEPRLGPRFTTVVEPPFVVIGDEVCERVRERAKNTVRWAATKLKADYFAKDPKTILDVYLFRDATSYETQARALFNERPSTPYGYYSSRDKALIMNIATGGGTLVHEIVHPFVEANLPDCPAWLNEGLGSLFEQSGESDGHIVGYVNWRLSGLKRALDRGAVPRFSKLVAMDDATFYGDESGVNYAAARYLLYYLQSRHLLVPFFRAYTAGRATDPTGAGTLERVLAEDDLDAFEERWKVFVLALG